MNLNATQSTISNSIDSSLSNNKPSIPSPWHCDKKVIKIKSMGVTPFLMEYLPFNMGTHSCSITFIDNKSGSFLYEIRGESLLPDNVETISLKCKDTESISHDIDFNNSFKNPLLLKARQIAFDRLSKQDKKLKNNQNVLQSQLQSNPTVYFVDVSSPYYVAPKQLKLFNDKESDNRFSFSFNPKGPGQYPCTIKFESYYQDGDNGDFNIGDIRIYNIEVTVQSEGTHAELEFNAHANEKVIQKLPIVNSTSNEWRIGVEMIGDAMNDFNLQQKEFTD